MNFYKENPDPGGGKKDMTVREDSDGPGVFFCV